jgi:hypothetical protein
VRSRAVFAIAALLTLPGCQTGQQLEAERENRGETARASVIGLTMTEFMTKTGVLPTDAYSGGGGRVFVVDNPPCRILLQTLAVGNAGSADDWRIYDVKTFGTCFL